jgi:hypothetical protein
MMDWLAPLLDGDPPVHWLGTPDDFERPLRAELEPERSETVPWPGLSEPIGFAVYRLTTPHRPIVGVWLSEDTGPFAIPGVCELIRAFCWADLSVDELKWLFAGIAIERLTGSGSRVVGRPPATEALPLPQLTGEVSEEEVAAACEAVAAAGWLETLEQRIGGQVLRQAPRRRPDGRFDIVATSTRASVTAPAGSALAYCGPLTVLLGKHFFAGGFSPADRARWVAADWD